MAIYAIEALDDSMSATRAFLFDPFSIRRWIVLSFLVFFLGGGSAGSYSTSTTNVLSDPPADATFQPIFREVLHVIVANLGLVVAAIGVVLAIGLVYWFIAAMMEIVFLESLRMDEVRVVRYAERHFSKGVSLFVFRTVLASLAVGVVVLLGYVALTLVTSGGALPIGMLGVIVIVGSLTVLGYSLVDGFTTAFVVPVMLVRNCGIIDGWRIYWTTFVRSWTQYLAYIVAVFFLRLGIGVVVSITTGVIALVLLLPLAPPAIVAYYVIGTGTVGLLIIGIIVVTYVGLVLLGLLLVRIPVESYFRYYAMFVLGDTNDELDPIPSIRNAVRNRSPSTIATDN